MAMPPDTDLFAFAPVGQRRNGYLPKPNTSWWKRPCSISTLSHSEPCARDAEAGERAVDQVGAVACVDGDVVAGLVALAFGEADADQARRARGFTNITLTLTLPTACGGGPSGGSIRPPA